MRVWLAKLLPAVTLCLAVTGLAPAGAQAVTVGISDQSPAMFSSPLFQALHIRQARLSVPWNLLTKPNAGTIQEVTAWLQAAAAEHVNPLISFARDNNTGRMPTVAQYTRGVKLFHRQFPSLTTFTAWNEPDWPQFPLGQRPVLAAQYFNALASICKHCTLLAGDMFLPAGQLRPYLRRYVKALRVRPSGWALHDYRDVRQRSTAQLKLLLKLTRGPIWLDETGGILARGNHYPFYDQTAAAAAADERYLFSLPRQFPRITRIYHYQWQATAGVFWDSALLDPAGTPRPALAVLAAACGVNPITLPGLPGIL